jgi:hypothetical protein
MCKMCLWHVFPPLVEAVRRSTSQKVSGLGSDDPYLCALDLK